MHLKNIYWINNVGTGELLSQQRLTPIITNPSPTELYHLQPAELLEKNTSLLSELLPDQVIRAAFLSLATKRH